ncbi:MAG: type II secretion system F family protein [Thermoguttaceae bacterium]
MTASQPAALRTVTLDELIALNDEIAALVRVGVPLELGLRQLGGDLPARMGRLAKDLAQRMERGESLIEVVEQSPQTFPPIYRAVLAAGLKSGRLALALESLASSAQRVAEARRIVAGALIYPLMVFLVAWGLFVFFVLKIAPVLAAVLGDFKVPGQVIFAVLASWGGSAAWWGPAVPVAVLLLAWVWAFLSGRAMSIEPHAMGVLLSWLPWTRRMLRSFRIAMFSEVLALLVENNVPLPAGLVLAAESVGNRRMLGASRALAESLQRGEPLAGRTQDMAGIPPFLYWLMATGQDHGGLLPALRHSADTYRRRARFQADAARLILPVALTVVLGGGITFLYALMVFGSWILLIRSLAGI